MARRRVPFAGRGKAGIDVGPPLRDHAEFEAGADRDVVAKADRLGEIIVSRLIVMRLGSDGCALLAQRPYLDWAARPAFLGEGALADDAGPELVDRRLINHAK